nr:glycosyltransferase [Halomarina oriensis]
MLREAEESARNQTIPVDIVTVADKNQRGPAWARNEGLNRAETRYVAFLDADDLWTTDKLERQLDRMAATGAGLCVEGTSRTTEDFVRDVFSGRLDSLTSSILVDTDQVTVTFEESLSRREDHLLLLEAATQGGVCFCPNLVDVRKHEGGLSAKTSRKLHFDSNVQFAELATERVPQTEQHLDVFYGSLHYGQGRRRHFDGQYRAAVDSFRTSLAFDVRLKTVAALLLSTTRLLTDRR